VVVTVLIVVADYAPIVAFVQAVIDVCQVVSCDLSVLVYPPLAAELAIAALV
jgi:hypothetical protein